MFNIDHFCIRIFLIKMNMYVNVSLSFYIELLAVFCFLKLNFVGFTFGKFDMLAII